MLAMHYRIPLAGMEAMAAVGRRAAERGPLFDRLDGLAHKFFLLDRADPTYATLYLWRDPAAAQAFLEGPLFAALVAAFGRPEVRLLLATAIELPDADPHEAVLTEGLRTLGFGPRIDCIDPCNGQSLSLRFDDAVRGRRLTLLYHARANRLAPAHLPLASAIA
jgi:hypothetical protein